MNAIGVNCRNLNQNAYGLVEASVGAGTLELASKDADGDYVVEPLTPQECALSQGP